MPSGGGAVDGFSQEKPMWRKQKRNSRIFQAVLNNQNGFFVDRNKGYFQIIMWLRPNTFFKEI